MSKFGWDYPPGCTQAMVDEAVGGGPEAEAAEAFADIFYDKLDALVADTGLSADEEKDELCKWVWNQIGEAYAKGYAQANVDRALAETETQADEKWP